jgi:hypothetical protein
MVNPMWRTPKGLRLPAAPDHWCRPSRRIHLVSRTAISGDLLSAVVSTCYILGFRKDNPNVFNMLVQNLPHSSGIKCICY